MNQANLELRTLPRRGALALGLGAAVLASLFLSVPARAQDDSAAGYSFVRTLEGDATLAGSDLDGRTELEINQPLITGDRVYLERGSRAEIVLSDFNLLRLGGGAELVFASLAASPDGDSERTHLELINGELQIVLSADAARSSEPLRVETGNSTIYLHEAGSYLVTAEDSDWSEVVVRQGYAEVQTGRGSVVVQENEQAVIEGDSRPQTSVEAATSLASLERWGLELESEARYAGLDDVDDSLRYASSSLGQHGSWVEIERGRRAWRPRVEDSWRPYTHGTWRYTSIGYTWVSSEPWGWVPYHYGTWDYAPSYGWVWYPGRQFAPAWVYWYWGPDYVGWCPTGYYSNYYARHYRRDDWRHDGWRHGSRSGIYGRAGGDWDRFADWSFVPTQRFGRRDQARYTRPSLAYRQQGGARLAEGVITSDTRGLNRAVIEKPVEVERVLRTRPGANNGAGVSNGQLLDLNDFVARRELKPEVEARLVETKPARTVTTRPGVVRNGNEGRVGGQATVGQPQVKPVEGRVAVPRATDRPTLERRPGVGSPSVSKPVVTPSDRKPADQPTITRRPGVSRPPNAPRSGGSVPEVSVPANRPSPGNQKEPEARIERRPARPSVLPQGRPAAPPATTPQVTRRPAAQPEAAPPAARIERRPSTPRPETTKPVEAPAVRMERRPSAPPAAPPVVRNPTPAEKPSGTVRSTPRPAPPPSSAPSVSSRPGSAQRQTPAAKPAAPPQQQSGDRSPRRRPDPPKEDKEGDG